MVDMFFYRDPEEIEKENEAAELAEEINRFDYGATTEDQDWTIEAEGPSSFAATAADWNTEAPSGEVGDWAEDVSAAPASSGWD
ncbi:Putative 40S ribosomal protein S0 [Rhizopus microsporus]|nr:Putative 40S ribosomal protein S0 [Rhizopus microsporus]